MKARLISFISAIVLLTGLVVWAAHSTWQRLQAMRLGLAAAKSESFAQADHFQQSILGLDNLLLRYQIRPEPGLWDQFLRMSRELERWIGAQSPLWTSRGEQVILGQLHQAYQVFVAQAIQMRDPSLPHNRVAASLVQYAQLEKTSRAVLDLGYQLADTHRKSRNVLWTQSLESLNHVQYILLGSLALLLVFGAGLAWVSYRELIAPLRVKLGESLELAERNEKLASLGVLATGVAHEIRNPLTAIKARLFILQRLLAGEAVGVANLQFISQEIDRLERIVQDFLLFARPSDPDLRTVGAEQPLREVHALLAPQLEQSDIRLILEDSYCAQVRIDPQQIKQVLINLIQNAADSIGRGGVITLRARADRRPLHGEVCAVIVLEVTDDGKGIPPEVQKKLFDPFFTTKENGTGLGLSIAARIAQKHGGSLQYQTQLNKGTTFGLVLPRAREPACVDEYQLTNPVN